MVRRISTSKEFIDIVTSIKGGVFVTVGYITGANLDVPKGKRLNPATNRMNSYPDYKEFGKAIGYDNVSGIIKLTSYTLNWRTPTSVHNAYVDYRKNLDKIKVEYGINPVNKDSGKGKYKTKQDYGNNGISVYSGKNDDLNGNTYPSQNVRNAKIKSSYFLINDSGNITNEVDKSQLTNFFKKKSEVDGVPALRKLGASEERIQEYIQKERALGMDYKSFESSSILYMVATVNGEKIIFINDLIKTNFKEFEVSKEDLHSLVKERYKKDLMTLDECTQEYHKEKLLKENGIQSIIWFN